MRASKEQAAKNRERVIETAARLFCERGFDGVGIDAVMEGAGLTHGGFYKNFASKDDLIVEACRRAATQAMERRAGNLGESEDSLSTLVTNYLSSAHCDDRADGCPFAALTGDAARREGPVREVFTEGLSRFAAQIVGLMPQRTQARRREAALAAIGTMIGAVAMARAVDDASFADEILAAARSAIIGRNVPANGSPKGKSHERS